MKIMVTRFIVAGLIAVSIGFGLFYFLRAPQPAISTYYQLSNLLQQNEYTTFDAQLVSMNTTYPLGGAVNSSFMVVEQALDNNFYYYNSYLLFVKNVSQSEQTLMNQKISFYKNSLEESYILLKHFNTNHSGNEVINAGMYQNFINAYKTQLTRYLDLVETLKNYVIRYAFDQTTPVGLKQTLLQVQLDYVTIIINNNYAYTYLIDELILIKGKYDNYLNAPQGQLVSVNSFILAYKNIASATLQEYIEASNKVAYVQGSTDSYVITIYEFLTRASYN